MASAITSGSASSFSDILTALESFLTTHGWTAQAGPAAAGNFLAQRILSKSGLVARFAVDNQVAIKGLWMRPATGISAGTTTGDAQDWVCLKDNPRAPVTFPVTYEIYWNDTPEEVYLIVSYGGNKYQHLNFGKSDQPDIGGTGMWATGAVAGGMVPDTSNSGKVYISYNNSSQADDYIYVTPYAGWGLGYFMEGNGYSYSYCTSYIHNALDGTARWSRGIDTQAVGSIYPFNNNNLLMVLPSAFNEAEILLPIMPLVRRPDTLWTITAALKHARHCRIDNQEPGDIITYGGDQWKLYPLYAKNVAQRNGASWTTGADHSGTLGVAIRYPGA